MEPLIESTQEMDRFRPQQAHPQVKYTLTPHFLYIGIVIQKDP